MLHRLTLCLLLHVGCLMAVEPETILQIVEKQFSVNGQAASIFTLTQPDGTSGIFAQKGQQFNVRVENHLNVPTSIHWHGLILPNDQDGVAFITQLPIYPGEYVDYRFPLVQAGTYWMHSHFALQEQKLLTAPLIIYGLDRLDIASEEAVIMLNDFSFKTAESIWHSLLAKGKENGLMPNMKMATKDIVEVDYDAFLANYRTAEDPELFFMETDEWIRLRFINAASATNFFLLFGKLNAVVVAVDGNRVQPYATHQVELGVAQRVDVLVRMPEGGGTYPILAQGEGTDKQTGVILATRGAAIPKLTNRAKETAGPLTNSQEFQLKALFPLDTRPVDQRIIVELGGNMVDYVWTLNGQAWPEVTPIVVKLGQRVEITFKNNTKMTHPMHFHGHVFQVTAIDGKPINGAKRDTVLVMPNSSVTIQFDADNPGVWPLHCHILYHLEAGMLTVVRYQDFVQPLAPIVTRT